MPRASAKPPQPAITCFRGLGCLVASLPHRQDLASACEGKSLRRSSAAMQRTSCPEAAQRCNALHVPKRAKRCRDRDRDRNRDRSRWFLAERQAFFAWLLREPCPERPKRCLIGCVFSSTFFVKKLLISRLEIRITIAERKG